MGGMHPPHPPLDPPLPVHKVGVGVVYKDPTNGAKILGFDSQTGKVVRRVVNGSPRAGAKGGPGGLGPPNRHLGPPINCLCLLK